jgi:hypothetical protein
MARIGGQHLAEQALGVVEAAGLLVVHGGGEQRPNSLRGCGGARGRLVRPGLVAVHGCVVGCDRAHKGLRDSPLSERDKPNWDGRRGQSHLERGREVLARWPGGRRLACSGGANCFWYIHRNVPHPVSAGRPQPSACTGCNLPSGTSPGVPQAHDTPTASWLPRSWWTELQEPE